MLILVETEIQGIKHAIPATSQMIAIAISPFRAIMSFISIITSFRSEKLDISRNSQGGAVVRSPQRPLERREKEAGDSLQRSMIQKQQRIVRTILFTLIFYPSNSDLNMIKTLLSVQELDTQQGTVRNSVIEGWIVQKADTLGRIVHCSIPSTHSAL